MSTSVYHPLVRSFIRSSLGFGWSGRQIYSALPSLGLPKFHRETFFKVVKGEREFLRVGKATTEFAGNIAFTKSLMVEEDFLSASRYRVSGVMELYDATEDVLFDTPFQFYSDENLGKDGWEDLFKQRYQPRYGEEDIELLGLSIDRVSHQPGFRY